MNLVMQANIKAMLGHPPINKYGRKVIAALFEKGNMRGRDVHKLLCGKVSMKDAVEPLVLKGDIVRKEIKENGAQTSWYSMASHLTKEDFGL